MYQQFLSHSSSFHMLQQWVQSPFDPVTSVRDIPTQRHPHLQVWAHDSWQDDKLGLHDVEDSISEE